MFGVKGPGYEDGTGKKGKIHKEDQVIKSKKNRRTIQSLYASRRAGQRDTPQLALLAMRDAQKDMMNEGWIRKSPS